MSYNTMRAQRDELLEALIAIRSLNAELTDKEYADEAYRIACLAIVKATGGES